jgi:hypothetical protein
VPDAAHPALIEESMKRTSLVWLDYERGVPPRPAWHAWNDGAAFVVSGGPEQKLPGIGDARRVVVITRAKDSRARLVSWVAAAETLLPWTDEWNQAVDILRPQRLNAATGGALADVWAGESTITRLAPTGEVVEGPGDYSTSSHAAPPLPSPATTVAASPWVMHRRPRRSPTL